MHVGIYACMYVRKCVCMYACIYVCMYVCMHACMYACIKLCSALYSNMLARFSTCNTHNYAIGIGLSFSIFRPN